LLLYVPSATKADLWSFNLFLPSEESWNSLQKEKNNPSTSIDASKLQQPDEKLSKINITHCIPPYEKISKINITYYSNKNI
jgi:hypothetical protein